MASFSSGISPEGGRECAAATAVAAAAADADAGGGGRLFVGSFNLNSQDLTVKAAKAWLKEAGDADIVALGLQECGVVPAEPFPEPTIGKAEARWNDIRDFAVPAINDADGSDPIDMSIDAIDGTLSPGVSSTASTATRKKFKTFPGMAQITEAAILKAREQADKHLAEDSAGVTSSGEDDMAGEGEGAPQDIADMAEVDDFPLPEENPALSRGCSASRSQYKDKRQESYYLRGVVEEDRDKALLTTIANCIPGRHLVADVAMGETPTHGKIKVSLSPRISGGSSSTETSLDGSDRDGGDCPLDVSGRSHAGHAVDGVLKGNQAFKTVEWYGTIRLLVFTRKDLFKDLRVRTVVIPSGDKPSVVADAPEDYAKDTSPDKGAVACYLEDPLSNLEVLLVNCHLYGTNKYGVGEAVFDEYRMTQLRVIEHALKATLPSTAPAHMVIFGDLNFRVELLNEAEDKAKGGKDFQAVVKMAEAGKAEDLLLLYNTGDRLRPLLRSATKEEEGSGGHGPREVGDGEDTLRESDQDSPELKADQQVVPLLAGLRDGLGAALARGEAVRPTFTFKPGDTNTPRKYNDKRTPSWPDRILWRGLMDHDLTDNQGDDQGDDQGDEGLTHRGSSFGAVPEVLSSDHEPVYCVLGVPFGAGHTSTA